MKRIYDEPEPEDGTRVLIDRLWPRGISKEEAQLDAWVKSVAPSDSLRRWYDHDPDRWEEFQDRYRSELDDANEPVEQMLEYSSSGSVTLVYAAKDRDHNNAVILQEYLKERLS